MECQKKTQKNMNNKSLALQRSYKVEGVIEPGLQYTVRTYVYCSKGEGILCMVSPELVLLHQDRSVI